MRSNVLNLIANVYPLMVKNEGFGFVIYIQTLHFFVSAESYETTISEGKILR